MNAPITQRVVIPGIALLAMVLGIATPVQAVTRTWTGNGADGLASNPDNWDGAVPTAGEHVRFADAHLGSSHTNAIWNLDPGAAGYASWIQTVDYAGTVKIMTRYPEAGDFTNLHMAGDVTLEGGVWTHEGPQTAPTYNLGVSVGGNFTLAAGASIDLDHKGWLQRSAAAPGGGSTSQHGTFTVGAAHGGMGGLRDWKSDYTYGSIFQPTHLGSSGGRYNDGGGALRLVCDGLVTVDGDILARWTTNDPSYGGASGGSIYIRAATFSGSGSLNAAAHTGRASGGGGRIAVVLTNGTSFGNVAMKAHGGVSQLAGPFSSSNAREGAAGTIYLQKAGQNRNEGILILDNQNTVLHADYVATPFFPAVTTIPANQMGDAPFDFDAFEKIIVRNGAALFAHTNTTLNLTTANLNPDGYTNGWIAVMQTNNIVFPENDFTLERYNLVLGTNWVFDGNLTVAANTVISHFGSMAETKDYGLDLTVTGDLTVEANGLIDVSSRGFLHQNGPGVAVTVPEGERRGGSHGGRGAGVDKDYYSNTYGSFLKPVTLGSGGQGQWNHAGYFGFFRGGGAARITVGGQTHVAGGILARGGDNGNWSVPGSGGSIWLTTGSLSGSGTLDARGGRHVNAAGYHGGGGRIAVCLTDTQTFGDVQLRVYGWRDGRNRTSAAGTLYRQWPGPWGTPLGELRIDNAGNTVEPDWVYTPIPADLEAPLLDSPWPGARQVTLVITNRAQVALNLDLHMLNLFLHNDVDPTRLYLQGHTLTLRSAYHHEWGHEDWVIYDDGAIVWTARGTIITLR